MIYGIYALEGLLLFFAGIEDVRKREIRVIYIVAMALVACYGCMVRQDHSWYGALGGLFIGVCMFGISIISGEQIGKGDGLVIAALGILCGVRNTLGIVCFASLFMVPIAFVVILLKRGKKRIRLPFLPALFLGYSMTFLLGGMS
ncbi:MAG: prepilin peptidase [Lachnospiraceae bacterium]|nr:prepilin peptidase [Lachnospiraceae bacterium]